MGLGYASRSEDYMKAEVPWLTTAIIFFHRGRISIAASSSTDSLAGTAFLFQKSLSALYFLAYKLALMIWLGVCQRQSSERHIQAVKPREVLLPSPLLSHTSIVNFLTCKVKSHWNHSLCEGVQKGEVPDPTFPFLFHGNPTSHTFFITIQNLIFLSQKYTLKGLISTTAAKACVWGVHVKLLMPESSKTKNSA